MIYGIGGIVIILFLLFYKTEEPVKPFNAEFEKIGRHTSIFNKGFSLTGGLRAITREMSYKSALVAGPVGSGKTSTVLVGSIFSLLRGFSSVIIMDVSKEIYKLVSGYVSRYADIFCFDLTITSDGFNPLAYCKTITDIQKVAHIIIKNSGVESKNDMYWASSSEALLSVVIQYLVFHADPKYLSMANVVRIVETFAAEPEKIDKLYLNTSEDLLRSYKAVNAAGDKTLASTISTTLVALRIFKNPDVARCTSYNTFDITTFRKKKSYLFICIPLHQLTVMAPVSALLIQSLFDEMLSRIPEKEEASTFLLLDEMMTMRFENLGQVFSNCRKYRTGIMGLVQDERMIEMRLSTAESHAVRTNSFSRVYLAGQPLATCKMLEDTLGRCTYVDEKGIEKTKPLLEAPAIRMCKESIILIGSEPPCLEKMKPFYSHFIYSGRTKIKPYENPKKIPYDTPPLIPLD